MRNLIVVFFFVELIPSVDADWRSLVFIVADSYGNERSKECSNFSNSFCTYGYLVDTPEKNVRWPDRYNQVFQILALRHYKTINWFSFWTQELGKCCEFQEHMYFENGQEKGLSPAEYFTRVTDFSSQGKRLNYLRVTNNNGCGFFISEVGYGQGPLRIVEDDAQPTIFTTYFLVQGPVLYRFYTLDMLKEQLTFDWFKNFFICREQPWICENQINRQS
ncbi:uncharacterized protein LOC142342134 [Convolutriloba macropyga]|uniref:uncharacterized protein LOC142342134 n=1 Tax=Convolutriloba macropyga TaxID=536237 RepID=UPI003F5219A1